MPIADLLAYATAAAAVASIIVQLLKALFIDPSLLSDGQRNAALRLMNYALNLAFVLMIVITHGEFAWSDLFAYIALAFGQSVGSHVGYKILTTPSEMPTDGNVAQPVPDAPPTTTPTDFSTDTTVPHISKI